MGDLALPGDDVDAMKVWLDDRREPPPGWVWVKTPAETIALLEAGGVDELSLDHDLGLWDDDGREQTGYDVLALDRGAGRPALLQAARARGALGQLGRRGSGWSRRSKRSSDTRREHRGERLLAKRPPDASDNISGTFAFNSSRRA